MAMITNTTIKKKYDENNVLIETEEEVSKVSFNKSNEEGEYIKIYFAEISKISKLPHACIPLLFEIARRISYANISDNENYGGQVVHLRKDVREKICDELGIKERAFYSNLKKLKNEGLIKLVGDSTYQLNPEAIGRGLFEYSPNKKYGGIKDLREVYRLDKEAKVQIEDNLVLREIIETQLEKLEKEYRNPENKEYKKYLAQSIRDFKEELKKSGEQDYSKNIVYKDKLKTIKKHLKAQNEQMSNLKEQVELFLDDFIDDDI